jgi:small subunit ribosomal protein S16
MAVTLRLKRTGRKNRPYYRIVAAEKRAPRGGTTLEILGHYDPLIDDPTKNTVLKKERAEYWLSVGAVPSETVLSIFHKHDVVIPIRAKRKRRAKKPKKDA